MTKEEAFERIQELVNADYPTYSLDGVETVVEGVPEPLFTNYKTAQFYRNMDEYAQRHPENEMDGVDYVDMLALEVSENPDVFYLSPAGTEYDEDAWVMKKYVELPGMVGLAYMKWFLLEHRNPILCIHLD